jgi:hypothetical protein
VRKQALAPGRIDGVSTRDARLASEQGKTVGTRDA